MTAHPDLDRRATIMEGQDRLMLARDVYEHVRVTDLKGWEKVAEPEDYGITDESGITAALYRKKNPETGEPEFAFAFSGMDGALDIDDAIQLGFTGLPDQYDPALTFVANAAHEFDVDVKKAEFTGHSLGGYLAKAVGLTVGAEKIWDFSSPGLKKGDIAQIEKNADLYQGLPAGTTQLCEDGMKACIRTFRSKYDMIAIWGKENGTLFEFKTDGHHHSTGMLDMAMMEAVTGSSETVGVIDRKTGHKMGVMDTLAAVADNISKSGVVRTVYRALHPDNLFG